MVESGDEEEEDMGAGGGGGDDGDDNDDDDDMDNVPLSVRLQAMSANPLCLRGGLLRRMLPLTSLTLRRR